MAQKEVILAGQQIFRAAILSLKLAALFYYRYLRPNAVEVLPNNGL